MLSDKYGPWAVIAGGSEGVGAQFALLLAGSGINVVLVARKQQPLTEVAQQCRRLGGEAVTVATDLADPAAVETLTAATRDREVGLLIYNAGANTASAEFLDAGLTDVAPVIDLNITTMLALVHHYGAAMRRRRRGGILMVGSMAGYLGSSRHTVYGGVKAFTRIFAEGLWLELRDSGVDVLHLVLGVTRTPAMERAGLNFDVPGMRVSDPADVARRNDPDRAKVVAGAHRFMQKLMGPT